MVIYLDNLLIYGTDLQHVQAETLLVLERLVDADFMVNTKKSHFLVSSL